MRVILIRHGKTELGAAYHFQSPNTPLSAQGLVRVEECADELAHKRIVKVYTSPYERATETAQRIAQRHALVPEEHAFFTEKFNGSAVVGCSYFSVPFVMLGLATIGHIFFPHVRYRDEETLDELWQRVKKAQSFLKEKAGNDDVIVIVSHRLWIAAFLEAQKKERPRIVRYTCLILRALAMRNVQRYDLEIDFRSKP